MKSNIETYKKIRMQIYFCDVKNLIGWYMEK